MYARVTAINARTALQPKVPDSIEMDQLHKRYKDPLMPACPNTVERGCSREDVKPIITTKPTRAERWFADEGNAKLREPYSTKVVQFSCASCGEDFAKRPPPFKRQLGVTLEQVWRAGKMPDCPECGFFQQVVRVVGPKPPFIAPTTLLPDLIKLAHQKKVKLADYYPAVDKKSEKRLTHYCFRCKHYWHQTRGPARLDPPQLYPGVRHDVKTHWAPAFDKPIAASAVTGHFRMEPHRPAYPFVDSFQHHPYDPTRRPPTPPPSSDEEEEEAPRGGITKADPWSMKKF